VQILEGILNTHSRKLAAGCQVEVGQLRAVTDKVLNSCVGDHLAVLQRDKFQLLAQFSEGLQVFVSEIVARSEIHRSEVRTIRRERANIPSRDAIEIEEGEVGVLDDVTDTIGCDVLHLV